MDHPMLSHSRLRDHLSFSSQVGERWYLCVVFAATLATCSLSVLPDVRASSTYSLAGDLEECCVFKPPPITNCSWTGADDSVRLCHIRKYTDSGMLTECYYPLDAPKKNQYPAPAENLDAQPFSVKCLPKNLSDTTLCSKYHNQYFSGLNITVKLSPYTAIFTQGLLVSLVGITANTGHFWYRFCRVFVFETSPEFAEINGGHLFFYDGFRWLEPGSTYQVTVRTLPIDEEHNAPVSNKFTLPTCNEVPDNYYCKVAARWQPTLLAVYPDWQAVNVTFDLAPDIYDFDRYCVTLKNASNNKTTLQKEVVPGTDSIYKRLMNGTNTKCISTMLGDIPPGNYVVQLQPQPSNREACLNPINKPVGCRKTGSQVFYVAGPSAPRQKGSTSDDINGVEAPTLGVPYATPTVPVQTTMSKQDSKMWLPILLGCIAGILALVVLFFMIHRSQIEDQSESSSKRIWKIPVTMSGDYDPKLAQKSLQNGLDLTKLKEQEFKLQKTLENDKDLPRDKVSSERQGTDLLEMQPLLVPHTTDAQEQLSCQSSRQGDFFRRGSCSSLGFTAEFMHVMYTQSTTKSISSLGTIEASTYRGSQTRIQRHNSKPDLVSLWWDKCPLLCNNDGVNLKRIGNSCPNITLLQHEGPSENV